MLQTNLIKALKPPDQSVHRFVGFILAMVLIFLTTGILFLFRSGLNTSTVALLYFLPILISTTLWGLWPGVFSAFTAFLSYNYFFLQPYYTFAVHESQNIITLIIFLVVAVFVSQLVGRARSSLAAAIARETETTRLYELSLELAVGNNLDEIATVIAQKTLETVPMAFLEIRITSFSGLTPYRLALPSKVDELQKPDLQIPLETVRAGFGEIRLWLNGAALKPDEKRMLQAFAAQGTLALERMALAQAETRAKILEESDRMKSSLLSSVSHEFRTPISSIKAAITSLLIDNISWDAADRKDLLSVVDEEIDYLNYLVGNLLDMSRIEAGALKPNRQWNILTEIIDSVLRRTYRVLSKFQVDLQIPDDLPLIPVDYSQMEQVFTNLLHNSAKYAPENSCIQIRAQVDGGDSIKVTIQNEGPQILPEHLTRIFDKFYRVTEPEKVSGTGLGLSICKGIIEAHAGQIWAENSPDGLAFNFSLPLILDGNPPPQIEIEK